MTDKPTVLLFDLGGVIVPWVGFDELPKLAGLSRDETVERFSSSDVANAYEVGKCDDATFMRAAIELFELDLTPDAFQAHWNSWVHPPYPGTLQALGSLRSEFTIACLSNTNASHWAHLKTLIDPDKVFDLPMASHLIRSAKPNPECFEIALSKLDLPADQVWFFDDSAGNVRAANAMGIKAFQVDPKTGVIPTLKDLGLLPA